MTKYRLAPPRLDRTDEIVRGHRERGEALGRLDGEPALGRYFWLLSPASSAFMMASVPSSFFGADELGEGFVTDFAAVAGFSCGSSRFGSEVITRVWYLGEGHRVTRRCPCHP